MGDEDMAEMDPLHSPFPLSLIGLGGEGRK